MLSERLFYARQNLRKVAPVFCIIWEDPDEIDAPAKVTYPDPNWLACALHGGILPPVDVYHIIRETLFYDEKGKPHVTHGFLLHSAPPAAAMTQREAIEYILEKDVPRRVWSRAHGNRPTYAIVETSDIPIDRTYRDAWELEGEAISVKTAAAQIMACGDQ